MQKIIIYIFILFTFSCVNKKDRLISELKSTVEYVSENKDSLTAEMLVVYDSQITDLEKITFPSQQKNMSPEEINQVNIFLKKYSVLKSRIEVREFINKLKNIVKYISENQSNISSETLEVYNSKIFDLREDKFLLYRNEMTVEEINDVNLLFGKYDALIIKIHLNDFKNILNDGLNILNDGLIQGSNTINELLSK